MATADIMMACICDYAGHVRGKGYPADQAEQRRVTGVGLAPTNLMITAFGQIGDSPWGASGEILMMPDSSTEVEILFDEGRAPERFVLCDLVELDGTPWECCPRGWLKRGLTALEDEFGLRLKVAFEHEFHYSGAPARLGDAYSLDAMRLQGRFGKDLIDALRNNDVDPEMFMPEFAPQQFEITCSPARALEAADRAVRLREITRAVARSLGHKATFAPVMEKGAVGNGVHIHFSLMDTQGNPVTYDSKARFSIARDPAHFVAGILQAMPDFIALTAASSVSYERLKPNRWSATYNNLGDKDREAGIRVCPLTRLPGVCAEESFNLEFRAADATANPYLALSALVHAGLNGLREKQPLPEAAGGDPGDLSTDEMARVGLRRLPESLSDALRLLQDSRVLQSWMGSALHNAYLVHKRSELDQVADIDIDGQIRRYAECY